MTTTLTVTSGTNGTLKQKKSLGRRMMRIAASTIFAVIAFATMSFTQDDTTKHAGENTVAMPDSCCMVTFVNGNQQIMITNTSAFTADIKINNMDLNTWVNNLKAYTYKRSNFSSIAQADSKMDVSFDRTERMNRKMAAAYSKNLETESAVADNQINNMFTEAVAAPLFSKTIKADVETADAAVDHMVADDADNKAKASKFTKAVTTGSVTADEQVDMMVYAATIDKNKKLNTTDADSKMDALINKTSSISPVSPAIGYTADQAIDALLKKLN